MTSLSVLDQFGPEILLLICDQLYGIAPESLPRLRLASRKLNEIAMPYIWRNMILRKDILEISPHEFVKHAVRMIHLHGRHVIIKSVLDWDLVAGFMTKCRYLQTLTWRNGCHSALGTCFPQRLKKVLEESPNLGLNVAYCGYKSDYIVNLFHDGPIEVASAVRSFPAANLLSFTVSILAQSGPVNNLQEFLAASTRLQTLRFESMDRFLPDGGRLPPIKALTLPYWDDTSESASRIWDFSLLEDLEISWSGFRQFLKAVSPEDLGKLKRFRVDDTSWEPQSSLLDKSKFETELFTEQLETLLKGRNDFQELDIRCLLSLFDMSLIAKQGQSLRVLTILDLAGFEMEGIFPTMSLSDLKILQQSCTRIAKLDIGINVIGNETISFLNIIAGFRNLDDLTIYIQSRLSEDTIDDIVEDIDLQSAMDIKNALVPLKCGVPFSTLRINVGGWRKAGPRQRRNDRNWDRRRTQGKNPERLFIVERNHEDYLLFREHRNWFQKPWPSSD
ncbi:hypothetical protein BGZ57DRAFT_1006225 [Hyaloscypha finlandica]|nr:hypothetical protein BGZ57DRAFT_1006225 [Hyaloscypha finlandica]